MISGALKISKMSGKLEGIKAINTNTLTNAFCTAMHKKEKTICADCYSINMLQTFRKSCAPAWQLNSDILSAGLINDELLPRFNSDDTVRFHGHGELLENADGSNVFGYNNNYHFQNFINIAAINPDTFFTLWTKRRDIVNAVLDSGVVLPGNLSLIYSNPAKNHLSRLPRYFDKTFNVITADQKENFSVNCSGRCADCMACYSRNNIETIVEVIK
jgi:hypothetical protein